MVDEKTITTTKGGVKVRIPGGEGRALRRPASGGLAESL